MHNDLFDLVSEPLADVSVARSNSGLDMFGKSELDDTAVSGRLIPAVEAETVSGRQNVSDGIKKRFLICTVPFSKTYLLLMTAPLQYLVQDPSKSNLAIHFGGPPSTMEPLTILILI